METACVDELISKIENEYSIVQGHRTAKNDDTNFAFLDGISEEVNNAIFRKGHTVLCLSASLIGSGFICEYKLLKTLMAKAVAVGGFDKELELMLLERKIRIGYAQDAIVYDEKIKQADAFVNQRRRWLAAQFMYFGNNIKNAIILLFKNGNLDYFDKLMQFLVSPRIITLGFSFIYTLSQLYRVIIDKDQDSFFSLYLGLGLLLVSTLAVGLAIPSKAYNLNMMKSIFSIPKGFVPTIWALIKIKGANKSFIHTEHG